MGMGVDVVFRCVDGVWSFCGEIRGRGEFRERKNILIRLFQVRGRGPISFHARPKKLITRV